MKLRKEILSVAILTILFFSVLVAATLAQETTKAKTPAVTQPAPVTTPVAQAEQDAINKLLAERREKEKDIEVIDSRIEVAVMRALAKAGKDPDKFRVNALQNGTFVIEEKPVPKPEK